MVGAHPMSGAGDKLWSITAVESQAKCGLGYFGQQVLRINEETDAATILSIEPAERGVLVHAVFEQLVNEWLAIEPRSTPAVAARRSPAGHASTGHRDPRRAAADRSASTSPRPCQRVARGACPHPAIDRRHARCRGRRGSRPVAGEHSFAGVEVAGASFGGKIDRIDLLPDGGLRVTDFKTSATMLDEEPARRWPPSAVALCMPAPPTTIVSPSRARQRRIRHRRRLAIFMSATARRPQRAMPLDPDVIRRLRDLRPQLARRDRGRPVRAATSSCATAAA